MALVRINKYISDTGFCSRREADQLIADERVTVNGILAEMGTKVSDTDKVKIDGQILRPAVKLPDEARPVKKKKIMSDEGDATPRRRGGKSGTRGSARNSRIGYVKPDDITSEKIARGFSVAKKDKYPSRKSGKSKSGLSGKK